MKPNYIPPEPPPQNEFERLLVRKQDDPTVYGQALRALMKLELHTLAEAHPEFAGEHELTAECVPQFLTFSGDDGGPFVAVFTSEAVVDWILPQIPLKGKQVGVVTMEAKALMSLLNNGKNKVRVNFGCQVSMTLKPEAISDLVSGQLTHLRPRSGAEEPTTLYGVEPDSLPPTLVATVRKFCDERRVPIAVYAFVPAKEGSKEPDMTELRIVLWLRSLDNDFYNDFGLMLGRLLPKGMTSATAVMTEKDKEGMAFLQRNKPLWPVTGEV